MPIQLQYFWSERSACHQRSNLGRPLVLVLINDNKVTCPKESICSYCIYYNLGYSAKKSNRQFIFQGDEYSYKL